MAAVLAHLLAYIETERLALFPLDKTDLCLSVLEKSETVVVTNAACEVVAPGVLRTRDVCVKLPVVLPVP